MDKIRKDVVGGPSIVFTSKLVVDKTFIRRFTPICKSFVGFDPSQLYPHSMCQHMCIGLYTRRDLNPEKSRLTSQKNRTRSFENMVISNVQLTRMGCKVGSFYTTGRQKKRLL